ncbi:Dipeptidyl peptidase IV [Candidatus Sulfotelmatomonas gaucii]|uniref:Dipeptidyl peptidase IV n=1 Tax=Candidatus Sulfuritelmatomonas gaucii TaxID=2043161 RepID=A0A2N9M0D7_9BACT|nr:Dipeptidyl peptidase IV [Candidatus Sulfotelmatomonas gaucii]
MTRISVVLLPAVAALSLAAGFIAAQTSEKPLTVEAIFAHGPLIGHPPDELTWSPDRKHLTYLEGGQLMEVDSATGRTHVLVSAAKMSPLDENNVSERDRDHRSRYNMAGYFWSPDSTHLLFDADGRLWLYDLHNGTGVQIGFTGLAAGDDPKFSPDGCCVSFIRDHGLAAIRLHDAGTPMISLAPSPAPAANNGQVLLNGQVDWVYEEELDVRSNYFWSPDSKNLAYLQMDETQVPRYPLADWIPNHASVDWQHYPQPGDANPVVHVGVVSVKGGKTTWVKLPIREGDDYIPRFGWVDHKTLWIEVLSRDHKHRVLYFADAEYGDARQVLEIDDRKFLDEDYDISVDDGAIVLASWSDGHNQLYLYSYDKEKPLGAEAKLEKQLTKGAFEVGDVYRVDTSHKAVDYASNEGNPLEQGIWRVGFNGDRAALSTDAGFHHASFSPDGSTFTDKFSTRMQPPVMRLCHETAPGAAASCRVFWETHALDSYHLRAPEQMEVKARDGTSLYATLLLPAGMTDPATVPLIVNPYGGPGEQTVANEWKDGLLFDELLTQHGFAVLHADNRGMGKRGRAFAQASYREFGPVQLADQMTVIDAALAKYPQLDPKRLGWWGWSWGGTFTLYAMTHSDRFRTGVAVAPVTDWRNYDSIYTERYLGLPADDADGYRDFSVVNSAANLKGRLLLAHGTGDDNVHMENTVQFVQKLIEAGIPYDLQIYPRKTHSIAGPDVRTHLYHRILAQFEEYLNPKESLDQKPEAPAGNGQ